MSKKLRPRIGLLPTGLNMYFHQYANLKEMGLAMYDKLVGKLSEYADVVSPGLVDTHETAMKAAEVFKEGDVDILLIFPFGYTTGTLIVPSVNAVNVPIRLVNAHEDSSYDYANADTELYLHHEGACPIPEYSCTLVAMKRAFQVITGHFGDDKFWEEVRRTCMGAAAAKAYSRCRFAVIGNTYTGMVDMPVDDHKILRATSQLVCRPEIQEIEQAYDAVTDEQLQEMYKEFREFYEVDESVTDEHMRESAKIAVAFDEIVKKYEIDGLGYYWWGQDEKYIQLRGQSSLAASRLTAMGIPSVTEGDVKAAMAMKILNLLGGGGMFLEFFSQDFDENFILMGHDGPSNVDLAVGKPKLQNLTTHHGKIGEGLGIDFDMKLGTCTILNLTQVGTDKTFKLIYTVAEVVPGDILNIGNPNCRVRVEKPIPEFFNDWCVEGPGHHSALGLGDLSKEIEVFAQTMNFDCVRV